MAVELEQNRWAVRPNQFAVRVIVSDPRGPFARSLFIEPGTRALVIEDGCYLGEVPPGEYTLESFAEKLQFWRRKQSTVILTRMEQQSIVFKIAGLPTRENLSVNAKVRLSVQMADVDTFLHNLMGPRDEYTVEQLQKSILPLVRQALWTSVGQMSIEELAGPHVGQELGAEIHKAMEASLTRYGIAFIEVQAVAIESEKYDAVREKQGDLWLANLRTEQMGEELDAYRKRAEVRQEIREALQSTAMDKISTKEEMRKFLEGINRDRIVRKEEMDQLLEGYEQRKQDRQAARKHMLSMLGLTRQQELEQARILANYAVKKTAIEHELLLARSAASRENEAWQRKLERERESAEHRRDQQLQEVNACWARKRESNRQQRDDEWDGLVHQERLHRLQSDLEYSRTEQQARVELLKVESGNRIDEQRILGERRRHEFEMEVREQRRYAQLEKMRGLQSLNEDAARAAHERELERLKTIGGLGAEAWIATADAPNAAALADVKKAEIGQSAAHLKLQAEKELNEERVRLYDKLNAAEKSRADAIADAFKASMQSQQGTVNQVVATLGLAASPGAIVPPSATAAVWHVSVNGQPSGPFTAQHIQQMSAAGQLTPATLVWKNGLPAWTPASQFPELLP